jgi:integrase
MLGAPESAAVQQWGSACRRRTPAHEASVPPERLFVKAVGFRPTAPRGKSLRIQISRHGWHAFRRGIATNLHQLGAADKDIQAILRHSNIGITMNIYVKSIAGSQVDTMDLLGEEFEKQQIGNLSRQTLRAN